MSVIEDSAQSAVSGCEHDLESVSPRPCPPDWSCRLPHFGESYTIQLQLDHRAAANPVTDKCKGCP